MSDLPNVMPLAFKIRGAAGYLTTRYSERKETAAKLEERVGLKSI